MPHHYTGQLGGGGASGYALAAADGVPELRTAPPPEFNGPRRLWSPEYLLLAAVETCFLFTLRATAKVSRVEFDSCAVTTKGTVDRVEGVTRFTE